MTLRTFRYWLYALAGLMAIGLGTYVGFNRPGPTQPKSGLIQPTNTIGGPFSLIDQTGKPVTDKDLLGKPVAMFFGYTFCPDVCPTTLAEVGQWLQALGPEADKLQFVFVTVDPARDTQEKLKAYLGSFDPRIRGLTGSVEEISNIVKAYHVFARKVVPENGGDYLMDHTAGIYLMDGKGYFVGLINYQEEADKAVAKLRSLAARG